MAHVTRTDLAGSIPTGSAEVLVSLVHLTDLHILDAASPARCEWVELEAADPRWRPMLHMHRPYDTLTAFALDAHVRAIRQRPIGPVTGRPFDLAVCTGDNIDNAQRNELDAYLALISGGVARLSAHGSAQDPSGSSTTPWPYWSPDPSAVDDWRRLGYPVVEDFVGRASAPIESAGLGVAWTSVPGNHDLMRQGTALTTPALETLAVSATKSLSRPLGLDPADPAALFLEEPEAFSRGSGRPIPADAARRSIDRREWIDAHTASGALGYAGRQVTGDGSRSVDGVVDVEHVRLVLLDTNHPDGDYEGSVGADQLAWLDDRLSEVEREPGRVAILVSHHGADTLINERGHRSDRRLADELTAVIHRHPCAVAWLVGHRHVNRIEPRPGPAGGFWEITTCSVIDWPSQTRAIELIRHSDATLELVCTMLDHRDDPDGLGSLHRHLARRFATTGVATRMAGRDVDGDVRLLLPGRG